METEHITKLIKTALPDALVEISSMKGTHNHLEITVFSDGFQGLPLIKQHQKIMDVLKEPLGSRILHAVKLKTKLLNQYPTQE